MRSSSQKYSLIFIQGAVRSYYHGPFTCYLININLSVYGLDLKVTSHICQFWYSNIIPQF